MRPLLIDEDEPPAPMAMAMVATAGSLATTSPSASCRRIISAKEMSCAASDTPLMRPVSCCGKKPLGMAMNRYTVPASVAKNTNSVANWWRSTMSSAQA